MLSSYDFDFFRTASGPFTNLMVLYPETKTCPEAAAEAATAAADQADQADAAAAAAAADQADQAADQAAESCRQLQTIGKSFQNHSGLGLGWLHLTRSELTP